jgi:hypothetical protein
LKVDESLPIDNEFETVENECELGLQLMRRGDIIFYNDDSEFIIMLLMKIGVKYIYQSHDFFAVTFKKVSSFKAMHEHSDLKQKGFEKSEANFWELMKAPELTETFTVYHSHQSKGILKDNISGSSPFETEKMVFTTKISKTAVAYSKMKFLLNNPVPPVPEKDQSRELEMFF